MTTRSRLQNANDSKSLWNYTLSPGWSAFDAHVLRLAVMKYGCGSWRNIGQHFPLKNCNQLNLQTQRLFGQQALAEFNKVNIDPNNIRVINDSIDGFRKNQCLINTGNNLSVQAREQRRKQHIQTHAIPKELSHQIQLPVVLDPPSQMCGVIDQIEKVREMYRCIYDIELRIRHLESNKVKNAANIKLNAQKNKNKNKKKTNDNSNGNNNNNKNTNESVSEGKQNDDDIVMNDEHKNDTANETSPEPPVAAPISMNEPMNEDVQMAMALSMSMAAANINTPAIEKKKKAKSKNGSKKKRKPSTKKKGKKRKKMDDDDDDTYILEPAKKRIKKK